MKNRIIYWRCTSCGCVVGREERPTKCLHCRKGESGLKLSSHERLYTKDENLNSIAEENRNKTIKADD